MSFPFKTPFALDGSKTAIPLQDSEGNVNFEDGYTQYYEINPEFDPITGYPTNPDAKLIERQKTNWLLYQITDSIRDLQLYGFPSWFPPADFSAYPLGAVVVHEGSVYQSTVANNTTVPGSLGASWEEGIGSSINVVQVAGTSEDDVISQAGVTNRIGIPLTGSIIDQNTVVLGGNALAQVSGNTAIGKSAQSLGGSSVSVGADSTGRAFGVAVGAGSETIGFNGVAIGHEALAANGNSVAIGQSSEAEGNSVSVGHEASASGNGGVAIGRQSGATGAGGVAIGQSSVALVNGVAIGVGAAQLSQNSVMIGGNSTLLEDSASSTLVGTEANIGTNAGGAIALGYQASVESAASGAIAIGAISTSQGTGSVVVGQSANASETGGISIGSQANASAGHSISIGSSSITNGFGGITIGSTAISTGAGVSIGNTAYGASTDSVCIGASTSVTGNEGVAVGKGASAGAGATGAVAIGSNTQSGGIGSVALGSGALSSSAGTIAIGGSSTSASFTGAIAIGSGAVADDIQSMALGAGATITGSYQNQIGNSTTTTYVYGTVQTRSDERDKAEIRDCELGLDFICKLRAREFKWDYREDYSPKKPDGLMPPEPLKDDATKEEKAKFKSQKKAWDEWVESKKLSNIVKDGSKKRNRYHQAFIAQEVKAVMDEMGVDFSGYQDHSLTAGGDDVKSLGMTAFIAPLVKAVQEQQAMIAELSRKLDALENGGNDEAV